MAQYDKLPLLFGVALAVGGCSVDAQPTSDSLDKTRTATLVAIDSAVGNLVLEQCGHPEASADYGPDNCIRVPIRVSQETLDTYRGRGQAQIMPNIVADTTQ
jgi:hypothetical protein